MKKLILFLSIITMSFQVILGEEVVKITKAQLEELGSKSTFTKEESLILRDKVIELDEIIVKNDERFQLLDKVIADKNQNIDELNEKVSKLEEEIKSIKVASADESVAELGKIYIFLKEYGAIILGVTLLLYLILFALTLSLNSKNKKIFEEYKEILELGEKKSLKPVKLETKKINIEKSDEVNIIPGLIKNKEEAEEKEEGFFKNRNGNSRGNANDLEDIG